MDPKPRSRLSKPPAFARLDWKIEELADSAHNIHHRDPEPDLDHQLWWARPPRPALVLGSTQPEELIDRAALEADDVEVARRRSGGGIVYLDSRTDCWIDVIVPAGSPLWDDDVGRAFHWLGQAWAEVLGQSSAQGDFVVSTGTPTSKTPGSPIATTRGTRPFWCFSEVGHGEVVSHGFKVVGLSQRRTRNWIRLQGLVLGHWPAARLARYVSTAKPAQGQTAKLSETVELSEPVDLRRDTTGQRFVNRDPFEVQAGPPPGQSLPGAEQLGSRFLSQFLG